MKTPADLARNLSMAAENDMVLLRKLVADREIADIIWGGRAQQAVEKLLKAILAARGINFPLTHQLFHLRDCLVEIRIELPAEFLPLLELTPYAGELRYSPLKATQTPPLDRPSILSLVEELRLFLQRQGLP